MSLRGSSVLGNRFRVFYIMKLGMMQPTVFRSPNNLGFGRGKVRVSPRLNIPVPSELSLDRFLVVNSKKAAVGVHSPSSSHDVPLPDSIKPVGVDISHDPSSLTVKAEELPLNLNRNQLFRTIATCLFRNLRLKVGDWCSKMRSRGRSNK